MTFSINAIYSWYRNTIRNPKYRWWIILGTFAYLISPFDISPDLFPIVGQIDDVALLTLLLAEVSQELIERVKMRRGDTVASETVATSAETVDVDAVPMEE